MAIRINRVYTRGGDTGETSLVGGQRIAKDSIRIESYGTVDELNAILGLARIGEPRPRRAPRRKADRDRLDAVLVRLQNELFNLGSDLATLPQRPPSEAARHRSRATSRSSRRRSTS